MKKPIVTISVVVVSLLAATPAGAAEQCARVTQAGGPVELNHGPCLSQYSALSLVGARALGRAWIPGRRGVIEACVLYTRVWRNHTLIVNSARSCRGASVEFGRSWNHDAFPQRTHLTAQTFFDIRYRWNGGRAVTERFTSPKASIVTF